MKDKKNLRLFVIEVKNLSFSFGSKIIFEKINFKIYKNDFVSIIGHNGCGKTTLIKILMGFYKPESGKVFINGIDSRSKEFKKINASFGYITQGTVATNLPITVKEIISIAGLCNKNFNKELYENTLNMFGLNGIEKELYRTLSGGQKQKVNIARCIAQHAEIIILDEPDSFLDERSEHEIMELIKRINIEKKITIIMISHDSYLVKKYSDRIYTIENYNVIEKKNGGIDLTGRNKKEKLLKRKT